MATVTGIPTAMAICWRRSQQHSSLSQAADEKSFPETMAAKVGMVWSGRAAMRTGPAPLFKRLCGCQSRRAARSPPMSKTRPHHQSSGRWHEFAFRVMHLQLVWMHSVNPLMFQYH